jgi:hypothetical protein
MYLAHVAHTDHPALIFSSARCVWDTWRHELVEWSRFESSLTELGTTKPTRKESQMDTYTAFNQNQAVSSESKEMVPRTTLPLTTYLCMQGVRIFRSRFDDEIKGKVAGSKARAFEKSVPGYLSKSKPSEMAARRENPWRNRRQNTKIQRVSQSRG